MIILQYHDIFFRLTAPRCPGMTAGAAVSLRKSHDIVILSFYNMVKGQATCQVMVQVRRSSGVVQVKIPEVRLRYFLPKSAYCETGFRFSF